MTEQSSQKRLSDQVALVTGSSSGIGAGVAKALAAAGASVVINYHHDEEGARKTLDEIEAAGGQGFIFKADVSKEEEVLALFTATIERFGTLHILINNSGIQKDAPFLEMTLEEWQQVMDVNLTGQFLCAREAAKEFIRRGPQPEVSKALGKIICMSSVHEVIPWAGHVNYAASKGGLMLLMKSIAQELAPKRIRVNSIGPGAIKTSINEDVWGTPEGEKKLLELIPYDRIGETDDIGNVAVWLASDESDYVTGHTLFADGGMTLYADFSNNG